MKRNRPRLEDLEGSASGPHRAVAAFSTDRDDPPSGAFIIGPYRYRLWRTFDHGDQSHRILFVMLNPSTANAAQDDPTLRRCIGFASDWGFGSLEICNLFAYRATNPSALGRIRDPIGRENDNHIVEAAGRATLIVAAWGTRGGLLGRASLVTSLLTRSCELLCLGTTIGGAPRHPLYVRRDASLVIYATRRSAADA